jgi:hypothetical protein
MEIKCFFREIDPRAEKLFTRRFLQKEMELHDIRVVRMSQVLLLLRNQPMIYDPEERKILIDIDVDWEEARDRLNGGDHSQREYAAGLDLNVDEAMGFIFFHECCHSDPTKSETQCDRYARERIIQHREGR